MNKTELNRERGAIDAYQFRYVKYHGKLDDGLQEVEEYAQHRMNWLRKYGAICLCCDNAPANTLDHIVPVNLGGKHRTNNIGYICKDCNSSKNDSDLESWLLRQPQALQNAYNGILQRSDYVKDFDPDKIWAKYVLNFKEKPRKPGQPVLSKYARLTPAYIREMPQEMKPIYYLTQEFRNRDKERRESEEQSQKRYNDHVQWRKEQDLAEEKKRNLIKEQKDADTRFQVRVALGTYAAIAIFLTVLSVYG